MKKKFFCKALGQLLLPILAPLLILGFLSGIVINDSLRHSIDQRYQAELEGYAQRVSSVTRELERLNLTLTTIPTITMRLKSVMAHANAGIRADEYTEFNSILDMLFSSSLSNEYIDSIYLYYDIGKDYFLSSSNRITNLNHFRDTQWHQDYLNAAPELTTWSRIRSAELPYADAHMLLTLYRRIYARGLGTPQGVLVLNIDLQRIQRLLNSLSASSSVSLIVADQNGTPLIYNDTYRAILANASPLPPDSFQGSASDLPPREILASNISYTVLTRPLGSDDWQMVCAVPTKILYARPIRLTQLTLLLVTVAVVLSLLIAASLARKNAGDIQGVVDSIDRAKIGLSITPNQKSKKDIYSYILQNVVDTFLEKDYLALQLSQRNYQSKLLELMALQAQLNPHFLFNTMETVHWKTVALSGGQNEASIMIENLCDILRYALESDEEFVPLEKEIQITNSYLEIQKIRYRGKFTFSLNCPAPLLQVPVMKLLLQPLLENCIYHGIKQKQTPSRITVDLEEERGQLKVSVADSGQGMEPERLAEVKARLAKPYQESSEHIGLYNTNKRIKLLYGDEYGLNISSVLDQGTVVCIYLPKQFPKAPASPGLSAQSEA